MKNRNSIIQKIAKSAIVICSLLFLSVKTNAQTSDTVLTQIKIFNPPAGTQFKKAAISPDGSKIVFSTVPPDIQVRMLDVKTGSIKVIGKHRFGSNKLLYSPDGKYIYSFNKMYSTIKIFSGVTGDSIKEISTKNLTSITDADISPDGKTLAVATVWYVFFFGLPDGTFQKSIKTPNAGYPVIKYFPDGKYIAGAGTGDSAIWVMDIANATSKIIAKCSNTSDIMVSKDNSTIYAGNEAGLIYGFDAVSGKSKVIYILKKWNCPENRNDCHLSDMAMSKNKTKMYWLNNGTDLMVYDLVKNKEITSIPCIDGFTNISISENGKFMVLTSNNYMQVFEIK